MDLSVQFCNKQTPYLSTLSKQGTKFSIYYFKFTNPSVSQIFDTQSEAPLLSELTMPPASRLHITTIIIRQLLLNKLSPTHVHIKKHSASTMSAGDNKCYNCARAQSVSVICPYTRHTKEMAREVATAPPHNHVNNACHKCARRYREQDVLHPKKILQNTQLSPDY